jgi:hypothetical protein
MKSWLVVELHIPEEFGEAVSNFLMEQGATGIEGIDGDLPSQGLISRKTVKRKGFFMPSVAI